MKNEEDPRRRRVAAIAAVIIMTLTLKLFSLEEIVKVSIIVKENNTHEAIPFCNILVYSDSVNIKSLVTDSDGISNFTLSPGKYTFKTMAAGYRHELKTVIIPRSNKLILLEVFPAKSTKDTIEPFKIPLLSTVTLSKSHSESIKGIVPSPTRDVNSVVSQAAGVYTRGSRDEGTTYIVDGIKVRGSTFPVTGGIPAKRGDSKYESPKAKKEMDEIIVNSEYSNKLTAGEINDFSKWKLWENESSFTLKKLAETFGIETGTRYCFNIIDQNGNAVIDARVKISDGTKVFRTHTDNKGIAECWLPSEIKDNLSAEITYFGVTYNINNPVSFDSNVNTVQIERTCEIPDTFDLAFIVDATGSMQDEIKYLKSEMAGLINNIKSENKNLIVRIATVFYRDTGDEYVTRVSDFTTNIESAQSFIRDNNADGGGDTPESMEIALRDAGNLNWSTNARARIAFLIADAPPHGQAENRITLEKAIINSTTNGIRIVPIACSSSEKSTELLMRNIALLTNGTYLYLTDHSGVGDSHMKPTTDKVDHKKLNKLLLSVIRRFTKAKHCNEQLEVNVDSNIVKSNYLEFIEPEITEMIHNDKNNNVNVKISVSPNPASCTVSIMAKWEINEILVYNINGKAFRKYKYPSSSIVEIDLSEFADGEYVLRVIGKNKSGTAKVIVQR